MGRKLVGTAAQLSWLVGVIAAACGGTTARTGGDTSASGTDAGRGSSSPTSPGGGEREPGTGMVTGGGPGSLAGEGPGSFGGAEPGIAGEAGSLGGYDDGSCLTGEPECVDLVVGQNSDFGSYPFKSAWLISGCYDKSGASCRTVVGECPFQTNAYVMRGAKTLENFSIKGVPGQHYKVTFNFNAVVEAKEYAGGTRDQDETVPGNSDTFVDSFYRDGEPTETGANTWRLTVYDERFAEQRHYFLNSFPAGQGFESNRTFLVSFSKAIVLVGGGKVTLTVHDPDCSTVDNCGPDLIPIDADACPAPRSLPHEADVSLPLVYQDPGYLKPLIATSKLNYLSGGSTAQPWHSQVGHLTVTKAEATSDPVTMDYP